MDKKWAYYSWLIIAFLFTLLLFKWPLLPNFVDIYYHLSVAGGFVKAGGFSAHDFWSYAPAGRANLYPPLFHFLILILMKSGLKPIFIARLLDLVSFPLFLVIILVFMQQLFNRRLAFFAVLISSSLYSFYLASSNFLPLTLAFMLGLLSLLVFKKRKIISAAIFLSLCFYTHAQAPWFFVLTYIIYGLLDRVDLKQCLKTVLLGLVLSLPIIIYLAANLNSYQPGLTYENFILELNLYILLAIPGLKKVFKEKSGYYLLLSLAISVFAFAFSYPYRYISGQGLLGWILLSSIGLGRIYEYIEAWSFKRPGQKNAAGVFAIALIVFFLVISPTLIFKRDKKLNLSIFNSTYINLVFPQKSVARPNDYSLSSSRFIGDLIEMVRDNSQRQDIIFTNLNFAGTIISSLTDRADALGMVREVVPRVKYDPILNARLIIWFKNYEGAGDRDLKLAVAKYNLEKVGETDIAYVYRNNSTKSKERVSKANIPNLIILTILLFAAYVLVWDLSRKRKKF